MNANPSAAPANAPRPGQRPPTNIWTHLAEIFDRCLDDDQRTRRLHGFTDPLMRTVLVLAAIGIGLLVLIALAATVLLLVGLAVPTASAWVPAAGAGGLTGSVVVGFLLRAGYRAAWRWLAGRARP